jgi:hypothetical protein
MGLYGQSLIALAGGPNRAQKEAMNQLPRTIETVERQFNLDIPTIPYAVCPSCSYTYRPSYPNGLKATPTYPEVCFYRTAFYRPACGASILRFGRPIKTFEYYSFFEWFGRLLALPGVETYGDRFCDEITDTPETPVDKRRPSDGRFYRELRDAEGKLFIADRGGEGRWIFSLHADFFNIEGNIIGGQHSSTGVMSMSCLNFPPEMRDDPAFIYIPGIIQGYHEPDSKEAQHQHFLKPLVDELVVGYEQGVCCYSAYDSYNPDQPYTRIHKHAIGPVIMDLKASRPFCGLSDVGSRLWCFYCKVWHGFYRLRTDFEEWVQTDNNRLREGAQKWRSAGSDNERASILNCYGTRYSELWRLPYWNPRDQVVADSMHIIDQIAKQRLFRGKHALGLENPHGKSNMHPNQVPADNLNANPAVAADEAAYIAAETARVDAETVPIAFRYDFAHPPDLALVGSDPGALPANILPNEDPMELLKTLDWTHLSVSQQSTRLSRINWMKPKLANNVNGIADDVAAIHVILSQECPSFHEYGNFERKLATKNRWMPLLYVCNDLMAFPEKYLSLAAQPSIPEKAVTKAQLAAGLRAWVSYFVCCAFTQPFFVDCVAVENF